MKIEQQLKKLAALGLTLDDGATIDDVLLAFDRKAFEERPFDLVLFALGTEVDDRKLCSDVWSFDTEGISSPGDYVKIVQRLLEMSGDAEYLKEINDCVDLDSRTAWIEYRSPDGIERFWMAKVSDKLVDIAAVSKVMTHIERDGKKFYYKDSGQAKVLFYLDGDTAAELNSLAGGELKPSPLE